MIGKSIFQNLKEGDRVLCNYGSEATVININVKKTMVKLRCDEKKWSCPHFYQYEITKKI